MKLGKGMYKDLEIWKIGQLDFNYLRWVKIPENFKKLGFDLKKNTDLLEEIDYVIANHQIRTRKNELEWEVSELRRNYELAKIRNHQLAADLADLVNKNYCRVL